MHNKYSLTKLVFKHRYLLSLLIIVFVVYFFTMARTQVGYGDSDELIALGYLLGVAHPPGYPLLVILIHAFTHLPLFLNAATAGNFLALLIQVMNIGWFYAISKILLIKCKHPRNTVALVAFISSLCLAFSTTFWFQANVIEKYGLTLLLILVAFYVSLTARTLGQLFLFGTIIGLGIFFHELFILVIPILLLSIVSQKTAPISSRGGLSFALGLCIGLSINILGLWLLNIRNVPFSYNFPQSVIGLINHLIRSTNSLPGSTIYLPATSFQFFDQALTHFFVTLAQQYVYLPLLIVVVSLKKLWRHSKSPLLLALVPFLIYGPIFAMYVGWPARATDIPSLYANQLSTITRYWLIAHAFFGLLVTMGVGYLFRTYSHLKKHLIGLSIGFAMVLLLVNCKEVNLSRFTTTHQLYRSILTSMPQNAVIICGSDWACFSLLYQTLVLGYRADVDVILWDWRFQSHYVRSRHLLTNDFDYNPELTMDIIATALKTRSVFGLDMPPDLFNLLGLTEGVLFARAHGQLFEILLTADNSGTTTRRLEFVPTNMPLTIPFMNYIELSQLERLLFSNRVSRYYGNISAASSYADFVTIQSPVYSLLNHYASVVNQTQANPFYLKEKPALTGDKLYSAALVAYNQNRLDVARNWAIGALLKDSTNTDTPLLLKQIKQKQTENIR